MSKSFTSKKDARQAIWNRLQGEKLARFPFPPHGRIPNFDGAATAANRLFSHSVMDGVNTMKVNPDAPQRYVRERALQHGITLFMPTPRLRSGFKRFDPLVISENAYAEAASLSKGDQFAQEISLDEIPQLDLIVAGSVAVTPDGKRCGKGEGYSDLEYAILQELGHEPIPVVTTVHPVQIVDTFPKDTHDLVLQYIVTPESVIETGADTPADGGIQWEKISESDFNEMPVLRKLFDTLHGKS